MRSMILALAAAVFPIAARAQQQPTSGPRLPSDVRREVVSRWNGANAMHASERLEIDSAQDVAGNLAVREGPLVIAGHVEGSVLAVNADVTLRPSARIDGDVLVVGGGVDGETVAHVAGSIRVYAAPLQYRMDGDQMIATGTGESSDDSWWRRLERNRNRDWANPLRVVQAGPYNRVEGLPISLGPAMYHALPWGSVELDAAAVVRTATSFASNKGDVGHNLRTEVRVGRDRTIGVGGQLFNVVDPVESWQLSDLEVALASFVVRRDYRDYYARHGANAFLTFYGRRWLSATASYGQERWDSRATQNPFTIFHGDDPWRPNPLMDAGTFHLATLDLVGDTRNDPDDPWSGWFVDANVEHGLGTIGSPAPTSSGAPLGVARHAEYTRGFFDVRRYNRLGPDAQLNLRVVLGGWMGGDPLPLERRLSVDGPGALPGFDFRSARGGVDVGTCEGLALVPGMPAECERIALGQIEYRGDLRFNFLGDWEDWPRRYRNAHGDAVWVLFADAGRGWQIGSPDGGLSYSSGAIPPLSTFRTDLGLGIDIDGIGVYAAKSVSTPAEPVNFFLRLRHRF
ncbi:MAG TPA: hypothetical protein VHB25_05930 [Gemmatimonadaceae bacterium]|nr:hypothetical protein [Gemmatimonadaceae bacterium]